MRCVFADTGSASLSTVFLDEQGSLVVHRLHREWTSGWATHGIETARGSLRLCSPRRVHPALMRTRYVGGLAVALGPVALAASTTASAQPPPAHGGKHAPPSASHAPTVNPNSGAAAAYLSGKQAMVGWHAPSTHEAVRDASGRPMLVLTTLNRGETLAIPSSTDDGTFCAVDLDRVAHLLRAATGDEHPVGPAHPGARLRHPGALRRARDPRRVRLSRPAPRVALEPWQGARGGPRRARRGRRGGRPLRARAGVRGRGRLPDEPVRARRRPPAQLLLGGLQRPAHEESRARHPG